MVDVLIQCRNTERVGVVWLQTALAAHHVLHFSLRLLSGLWAGGDRRKLHEIPPIQQLLCHTEWDEDLRLAGVHSQHSCLSGFHHPDHQEPASAKQNVFAKSAVAVRVNLQFRDGGLVHQCHLSRCINVNLAERTTAHHLAAHGVVPCWPNSVHGHAVNEFRVTLNAHGQINNRRNALDGGALVHDCLCFADFEATLLPRKLSARNVVGAVGEHVQTCCTNTLKFGKHFGFQPSQRCNHCCDTGNTNNDSQRGEKRSRLVCPDLTERHTNRLQEEEDGESAAFTLGALPRWCFGVRHVVASVASSAAARRRCVARASST